jgi:hypothetical protein
MADELFQIKGDAPAVPDLKFWSVLGHGACRGRRTTS